MINNNSEILFLYDAQMCNPNGDMDNENKPRMDYDTSTNLVSDVRLKRYLRDYFETGLGKEIFITNSAKDAKDRNKQLKDKKMKHTDLIDIRLFGAVTTEDTVGGHFTGPVQFNWGYSLNPVEIIESATITSSFSSQQGVGKDFRLYYSLIAFSGSINANAAQTTELTADDIDLLDNGMLKAIPLARTRSKIGQYPRLYMRIEMNGKTQFLKDLRTMIKLVPGDRIAENPHMIRNCGDFSLDVQQLREYLVQNKANISAIYYWKDNEISIPDFENILAINAVWNKPLTM